jgi:hypothetical protein
MGAHTVVSRPSAKRESRDPGAARFGRVTPLGRHPSLGPWVRIFAPAAPELVRDTGGESCADQERVGCQRVGWVSAPKGVHARP